MNKQNSSEDKSLSVNVKDFGAMGDGKTDDSKAIQTAINYAHTKGYDVFIPKTQYSYNLHNILLLKEGVSLYSNGAQINRNFSRAVSGWAVFLEGDNEISGINYDGGNRYISLDLSSNEFIYYADFVTDRSAKLPTRFLNNVFNHSCGTFILGNSENVLIKNNIFKDYLDHAVYFGGRNYEGKISGNIIVDGNTFTTSDLSTREAVKVRNGMNVFLLINNIIDLPKAAFSTFDVGDSVISPQSNSNITLSGNIGYCSRFTLFNGGVNNTFTNNNINIFGNNVTCNDYVISLGGLPTTPTNQRATMLKNANISQNVFKTSYRFSILNGDLRGAIDNLNIINNIIEIGNQSVLFFLLGNIKFLNFSGNTVLSNKLSFSQKGYFDFSKIYDNKSVFSPTETGTIIIHNNSFNGKIQSIIYDDSSASSNSFSAIKWWNFDLMGNTMISDTNKIPVNIVGTYEHTIKTSCRIQETRLIGGAQGVNKHKNFVDDRSL